MLSGQVAEELSAEPILSAVDSYRGVWIDLDRGVVVRPDAFVRGRQDLVRQMVHCGLEPGDRVVIAVGNGPLFPAVLAATLLAGGSPLLVHAETPPAELKRTALRYGARFILSDSRGEEELQDSVRTIDVFDVDAWARALWGEMDDHAPEFPRDFERLPSVPLHPTSGTTGWTRVAARPGPCAVAEAAHYVETIGIESRDVILAVAPMSHAYTYGMGVMVPLVSGATCVSMRRFGVKSIRQAVEDYRISILPAVPAMLDMLVFGAGDRLRRFVHHVFAAGSPLSERTARNFLRVSGLRVRPLYGTTETGGIAVGGPEEADKYGGCIGRPMREVGVEIRRGHRHRDLPPGVGSVYVRNTSMMAGYVAEDALDGSPIEDGWFRTGDLGLIDDDGAVCLKARETEVINVYGLKVVPSEVEEVIASLPGVVEVKVYPGQQASGAQFVKAAVVVEDGVDVARIKAHCQEHLVYYKRPERIAILEALPRSPAGKIVRDQLP
jgi:acyl-coenzyme A synthetase/AMP-(fatty) acid ligase